MIYPVILLLLWLTVATCFALFIHNWSLKRVIFSIRLLLIFFLTGITLLFMSIVML